jgi:DNA-binding NtrC family response regulator
MQQAINTIKKWLLPMPIFLGENGTGKFVMAEYIHQNSKRKTNLLYT